MGLFSSTKKSTTNNYSETNSAIARENGIALSGTGNSLTMVDPGAFALAGQSIDGMAYVSDRSIAAMLESNARSLEANYLTSELAARTSMAALESMGYTTSNAMAAMHATSADAMYNMGATSSVAIRNVSELAYESIFGIGQSAANSLAFAADNVAAMMATFMGGQQLSSEAMAQASAATGQALNYMAETADNASRSEDARNVETMIKWGVLAIGAVALAWAMKGKL